MSTNRIVHPQRKTGTLSDKQNNVKQNDGQKSTWVWLPSVAGIITDLGSICIKSL